MRLAAIVPATDHPPTLGRCVEAIRVAEDPPEELIVVENAAGPGPAAARNAGAALASADADVLVFVDADVLPRRGAFRRIRLAFATEPELDGVFGSYDDEPEAPGIVSGFRNLLHHHVHQSGGGPAHTFWAGLGAIRRDAFAASGGFDAERFPAASVEDIELGLRLTDAGSRIVLDPAIQGTHLKAWTLAEMLRVDFERRGRPWSELLLERRDGTATLNLAWEHRLSALASLVGVTAACARRPRLAAGCLGALLVLNARFYGLLLRRRGPAGAVTGPALHALHHLAGVGAAATTVGAALARRLR